MEDKNGKEEFIIPESQKFLVVDYKDHIEQLFDVEVGYGHIFKHPDPNQPDQRWIEVHGSESNCKEAQVYIRALTTPAESLVMPYPEQLQDMLMHPSVHTKLERQSRAAIVFVEGGEMHLHGCDSLAVTLAMSAVEDLINKYLQHAAPEPAVRQSARRVDQELRRLSSGNDAFCLGSDDLSNMNETFKRTMLQWMSEEEVIGSGGGRLRSAEETVPTTIRESKNETDTVSTPLSGFSNHHSSPDPRTLPKPHSYLVAPAAPDQPLISHSLSAVDLPTSQSNPTLRDTAKRQGYSDPEINIVFEKLGHDCKTSDFLTALIQNRNAESLKASLLLAKPSSQVDLQTPSSQYPRNSNLKLMTPDSFTLSSDKKSDGNVIDLTSSPVFFSIDSPSKVNQKALEKEDVTNRFQMIDLTVSPSHSRQHTPSKADFPTTLPNVTTTIHVSNQNTTQKSKESEPFSVPKCIQDYNSSETAEVESVEEMRRKADEKQKLLKEAFAGSAKDEWQVISSDDSDDCIELKLDETVQDDRQSNLKGPSGLKVDMDPTNPFSIPYQLVTNKNRKSHTPAENQLDQSKPVCAEGGPLDPPSKKKRNKKSRWQDRSASPQKRGMSPNVNKNVGACAPNAKNTRSSTQAATHQNNGNMQRPNASNPNIPSLLDLPTKLPNAAPKDKMKGRVPRFIVIDGSNIAMEHGKHEYFSCRGIELAVQYFVRRGHKDVVAFVPQWRQKRPRDDKPIRDQELLEVLYKKKQLVWTPHRKVGGKTIESYDDRWVLRLAMDTEGVVVSNDMYRDLYEEHPEFRFTIEHRLLPGRFVGDYFMVPDDPMGRNGPMLDEFLTKPSIAEEEEAATGHPAAWTRGGAGLLGDYPGQVPLTVADAAQPPPSLSHQQFPSLPHPAPASNRQQLAPAERGDGFTWQQQQQHNNTNSAGRALRGGTQAAAQGERASRTAASRPVKGTGGAQRRDSESGATESTAAKAGKPRPQALSHELFFQLQNVFPGSEAKAKILKVLQSHPSESDINKLSVYVLDII